MQIRTNGIFPFTPATDFTEKEGYGVTLAGETATLGASATVQNRGIVLDGTTTSGKSAIGILGAIAGTVNAKLGGAVTKGDLLIQKNDGTWVTDTGAGARVSALVALETGVAGDLIECAPQTPITLA